VLAATPTIVIDGIAAEVSFAGLVGPGLYQFNVVVPSTVTLGQDVLWSGCRRILKRSPVRSSRSPLSKREVGRSAAGDCNAQPRQMVSRCARSYNRVCVWLLSGACQPLRNTCPKCCLFGPNQFKTSGFVEFQSASVSTAQTMRIWTLRVPRLRCPATPIAASSSTPRNASVGPSRSAITD
jgi:hypothetical protein